MAAKVLIALFFIFLSSLTLDAQAPPQHVHPEVLPTDRATWNRCCHEMDCHPAKITVYHRGDEFWIIAAEGSNPFKVSRPKVHISKNGREYMCTCGMTEDSEYCVNGAPANSDGEVYCIFVNWGSI